MTMREIEAMQIETGMLYGDDRITDVRYEDPEWGDYLILTTRSWLGYTDRVRIHWDETFMLDSEGRLW